LAGGVDKSIHPLYIEIVEPLTERTKLWLLNKRTILSK
jgi:hypothetical protein